MRESGILQPIFSLPSRFGIGSFSKEAFEFVDFLYKSGVGYWQILPVGPTGFGNSPYQPFSAFAGNPYFISIEDLIEEGYLTWDEANGAFFGSDPESVDYGALYENRDNLLRIAFSRFSEKGDQKEYKAYQKKEAYWLTDYALFMAIKKDQDQKSWQDWEDGLKKRKKAAIDKAKKELADEIEFVFFKQYLFDLQLRKLHAYAASKNVKIIGDLPFYVSLDSADAWSHPEVFCMDKDLKPTLVAGCPPDAFCADGQLWGNPLYDWDKLAEDGYDWWVRRIERNYEFYDVIRLDHFHGFESYYAVPFGAQNARKGEILKGPGMKLFDTLTKKLSAHCTDDFTGSSPADKKKKRLPMIAEDLGNNTPENEKLLADSGFPGMKVLQYAFTSWDSYYVNHKHERNCVVYTGTHDNTPLRAWVEEINEGERDFARRYINSMNTDYGAFVWDMIREAYRSVADLCIVPLTDYLTKGKEARINMPGSGEGNWQWRLKPNFLSDDLARSIRGLAEIYGRIPVEKSAKEEKK
ncbi:MAG: 4-alpha-glucanotransferase [Lachnospiraceae bacterium]|nr:4-alpha-glucanotransferase [Lachnospiraceae bacterium]